MSAPDLDRLLSALATAGVRQSAMVVRDGCVILAGEAEFVARACIGWGERDLADQIADRAGDGRCIVIEVSEQRAHVRHEQIVRLSPRGSA